MKYESFVFSLISLTMAQQSTQHEDVLELENEMLTATGILSPPREAPLDKGCNHTQGTIETDIDAPIEKPRGISMYILFSAVFASGFLMALNGSMVATVGFKRDLKYWVLTEHVFLRRSLE